MKISITCLIVALFWNIAATQQLSIYTSNATVDKPRDVILASDVAGGEWAIISRYNKRDPAAQGYHPSFTVIFSKYEPIVQKVGGTWQITFTAEISQNIH